MDETREQAQARYEAVKAELNELYERSRRAIHPLTIAEYERRISYLECCASTILH